MSSNSNAAAYAVEPGSRHPPGVQWSAALTNFSVYCRRARRVELLLYAAPEDSEPFQIIPLDPSRHRSRFFWHVAVRSLPAGTLYNWRIEVVDEGISPAAKFEALDPLARAVSDLQWDRLEAMARPDGPLGIRGIVTDAAFDWGGEYTPASLDGAVIYELHVGGFTRHPSSGVRFPGSFEGLIEKIPYLKDLGITHVELMPVAAFDEQDVPASVAALGLVNFWGYSPYALCAPHPGYCVSRDSADQVQEFRRMVRAFHEAGIGVLVDVVLNHTAEGGATGPAISQKALMPEVFYHRTGNELRDYTGCGNTVNCNHPLVMQMLLQSLEVWAHEMRVDGFRFDLASVFTRDVDGTPRDDAPFPWAIEAALGSRMLVAEPWDAAGLYHAGNFPGIDWREWNGRFRDAIRRFLRGDTDVLGEIATSLAGSSDLFKASDRTPRHSINYVTSHDGFTLADLASYGEKHNEANGEGNRDGWAHNFSWNYGTEGDTLDEAVTGVRRQYARNAVVLLMLSQGIPMLLAGDEVLRTQNGNNNAWCQDNALGWLDWRLTEAQGDMLAFVREMIAFRKRHPALWRTRFLSGRPDDARGIPDILWHGVQLGIPPWSPLAIDPNPRVLGFTLAGASELEPHIHMLANMSDGDEAVVLPSLDRRRWHLAIDTSKPAAGAIVPAGEQLPWSEPGFTSKARSVSVFEAR